MTKSKFEEIAQAFGFDLAKYRRYRRQPSWWAQQLGLRLNLYTRADGKNPYVNWAVQRLIGNPLGDTSGITSSSAARKPSRQEVLDWASRIPPSPPPPAGRPRPERLHESYPYDWGFEAERRMLLVVDLGAPDDSIEKNLAELVATGRHELQLQTRRRRSHKGVTVHELARWEVSRLLPYLDLRLLSKLSGSRPSESQLVRLLFPEKIEPGRGSLDTDLLNTAQAQEKRMFNEQFVLMLYLQGQEPRKR